MIDMRATIAPKSNQLNADDLIGMTRTIRVTKVSKSSEPEQPIAINFEGDGGKPFLPGKSMRRVLVNVWGDDGNAYVGKSMTLYRDDAVTFGGVAVGGIRISHMSGIDREVRMALSESKTKRKVFTVRPLAVAAEQDKPADGATALIERIRALTTREALEALTADAKVSKQRAWMADNRPELAAMVDAAVTELLTRLDNGEVVL